MQIVSILILNAFHSYQKVMVIASVPGALRDAKSCP